ncbi:hypothetical protein LPY66_19645 [Dehalobacter sp. DCM]|uniref:hypothetical protein n=1 Tax=Dehalobacter sp. DCM TaxID=2907827 RepID=UPI003081409D|nr:hypothetical protein LPY66_19645 [Dehalobacter sp. DCM]
MSSQLRSVTIKFDQELFEQIRLIADKRGETTSDTVRYLLARGLEERIYEQNAELIARIVREEVEKAMLPYTGFVPQTVPQRAKPKLVPAQDPRSLALFRRTS